MYSIDELFNMREAVGSRLESLLLKQGFTKTKFCADVGISRPTLDKLLSGSISSKANFINHMEKILRCLAMTPDMLMGNITNPYMKAKSMRNALRIKADDICNETGISSERLKEIEGGADATMAELRDIAFCLRTGVKSVVGENVFSSQVSILADLLNRSDDDNNNDASGFWGHIGILPAHSKEYLWYPITTNTRSLVHRMLNKERIVVPCMNNKLLYINTQNVSSIVLLDEACDSPDFANWDPGVDCGEIPQVVYESLDDYYYREDIGLSSDNDEFSPRFLAAIERIIQDEKWDEDTISEIVDTISIHYSNGEVVQTSIEFNEFETITSEIETIYNFEECIDEERFLYYEDYNGAEIMINTRNLSIIELPLAKTEAAISHNLMKSMEEEFNS